MTTEEKLKHFEESSMEKARAQSAQIIAEHKSALEKIENEHKASKERQAALQIKTETASLKRSNNMALSKEQLQIKRRITMEHNELKEKLFIEVKAKLEEYMGTPDYEQYLIRLICAAQEIAGADPLTIYLDPADSSMRHSLQAATNTQLTISEYSFMGGIRAILPDHHILIDHSFETKLQEEKEAFTFNGGIAHE